MTILIISALHDEHTPVVMEALAARGTVAELVDLSEFPTRLALSMSFEGGNHRHRLVRRGGGTLDLDAVRAAWWRRPQPFKFPEAISDPTYRHFALSESNTAFQGLYQSLEATWVNDPLLDAAAAHKPYQLTVAQRVGMDIPDTLMTNDPELAISFWAANPGEVIYKQFLALPDTWRETRRLRDEEQALAECIQYAPVIFQRHVPAVADLRVIAVGDTLFAAAADARNASYPQDVRVNVDVKYVPHELPYDVADKLRNLMRALGLIYGAADFRLTDDGKYVFLEINPAGQFLYIEQSTGQPIAATLAAFLDEADRGT